MGLGFIPQLYRSFCFFKKISSSKTVQFLVLIYAKLSLHVHPNRSAKSIYRCICKTLYLNILIQFHNKIICGHRARFLSYNHSEVKSVLFLMGHIVAMVTHYEEKKAITCSPTLMFLWSVIVVVSIGTRVVVSIRQSEPDGK